MGRDRDLAEHAAALIACASLADGTIDPDRLRWVVEYAHAMHVSDGWVRDVLQLARGHLAWAMADMTRRNVSNFPGFANADDTLPPMMPNAFTGVWPVPHDGLHVLSGYSTSIQGDLLVSAFTGGMHRRDALRAQILPTIFEWHVGHEVNGIGEQEGALDPVKFLISWQRGEAATTDVLSPDWNFFDIVDRDLEELRWAYGIPPLMPAHAAGGAEINIDATADPYAN